jgi:hypothetical protein
MAGGMVYIFETTGITEYRKSDEMVAGGLSDLQIVIFFRKGDCFGLEKEG